MLINKEQIKKEIEDILPEVITMRHYLHANPELSLKEYNTAKYIRERLASLDVELLDPFLETDVVAILNGKNPGKNLTLRADIDALPIKENNSISYSSKNRGVMHACGHDGHTSMLFGAAIILSKMKNELNGSVRFVFQPGEENVAAGKDLIEQGVLNNPKPEAILALHGWPGFPTGTICSRSGNFMAALDHFYIKIIGKGGHGSAPDKVNDPVLTAARIVQNIYSLPITKFSALEQVVFSVGKINGGMSPNIIPDEVTIEGTTRYFGKETGQIIPEIFEEFLKNECFTGGCEYELVYKRPYISTVNNAEIVEKCKKYTEKYLGKSYWVDMDKPVMGAEDFSYYIDRNPGAMFFLGMGEDSDGLHTNFYDFNDTALNNGILFFVVSTLRLLDD